MRISRKHRRWLLLALPPAFGLGLLAWVFVLEPLGDADPVSQRRSASSASSVAGAPADPSRAAATQALTELRRGLLLAPRRAATHRLALFGDRVARVVHDAVLISDLAATTEEQVALEGCRWVMSGPEDSLLAVGSREMLLFSSEAAKPQRFPRVTLLPATEVMFDLNRPGHLWTWNRGEDTLYHYDLGQERTGLLAPVATQTLVGAGNGFLLPLRDGSFVFPSELGLLRAFAGGPSRDLRPERRQPVWRALRSRRHDELIVLYEAAVLERAQIQDRLRTRATLQLEELPFDIASSQRAVAMLRLSQAGPNRRWQLVVLDLNLEPLLETELSENVVPLGIEDWSQRLSDEHSLAIGEQAVVVGGPQALQIWRLPERTGRAR